MLEHMRTHHIDISKYVANPEDYVFANDIVKNITTGDTIKAYRMKENLSRREASILLGITPNELKNIEEGNIVINKKLAVKMAMVFAVPLYCLISIN